MKKKKLKKLKLQKETIAKINLNKIMGGNHPTLRTQQVSIGPACVGP